MSHTWPIPRNQASRHAYVSMRSSRGCPAVPAGPRLRYDAGTLRSALSGKQATPARAVIARRTASPSPSYEAGQLAVVDLHSSTSPWTPFGRGCMTSSRSAVRGQQLLRSRRSDADALRRCQLQGDDRRSDSAGRRVADERGVHEEGRQVGPIGPMRISPLGSGHGKLTSSSGSPNAVFGELSAWASSRPSGASPSMPSGPSAASRRSGRAASPSAPRQPARARRTTEDRNCWRRVRTSQRRVPPSSARLAPTSAPSTSGPNRPAPRRPGRRRWSPATAGGAG